eukprot:6725603-Ditylum_brightwellii.AAC.1
MFDKCFYCKKRDCDGAKCLDRNSCFRCHKTNQFCPHKNTCTLQRHKLFKSNGNFHPFCTWCFAPKSNEFNIAMGDDFHHR